MQELAAVGSPPTGESATRKIALSSLGIAATPQLPALLCVDVVYMRRQEKGDDGFLKRSAAPAYYRLTRVLTGIEVADRQADFRLVSRRVIREVTDVTGDKVLRLLLPAVGYRSCTLTYQTQPRLAGKGRFGLTRQVRLAIDSVLEFSSQPLRLIAGVGLALSVFAFLWLVAVIATFFVTKTVSGWASVMTAVLLVGGLTLLSLSIVGEYIARIHDMIKGKPRYSIAAVLTSDRAQGPTDPPAA